MAVSEKLIASAIEKLTSKGYTPRSGHAAVVDFLANLDAFMDLGDDELDDLATTVLPRLGTGATSQQRPGPVPGPARIVSQARQVTTDATPSAPFRFVDLPDTVAMPDPGTNGSSSVPLEGGVCATIHVEWVAETPLLIGAEKNGMVEPLTLGVGNDYVIPGATFRGLIRAGMEIVAHGRSGAANLHHRYGLRDFDHPGYSYPAPIARADQVKAGWLTKVRVKDPAGLTKEIWQIAPLGDRWDHVLIDAMKGRCGMTDRESWIGKKLLAKYDAAGMRDRNGVIDFEKTTSFGPSSADQYGRRTTAPGTGRTGTLVFAGKLPGRGGNKKYEYVFFGSGDAPVPISDQEVALFKLLHCKPSKNKSIPDGSWADLIKTFEAGRRVPVFYVGDIQTQSKDFAFGLTRLFKMPHENSVGDLLARQPEHRVDPETIKAGAYPADFVENLFGHVVERDEIGLEKGVRVATDAVARKGRIAFGFGRLKDGMRGKLSDPIEAVMMAPRASYAPFYLRSSSEKDYSAANPRLAGRKRYLPRRTANKSLLQILSEIREMGERQKRMIRDQGGTVSPDVVTKMRFLLPVDTAELRFESEIRLHNVSAEELGAVLFVLTHGGDPAKPYRHMIGRARPFGAGQMRVASARLSVTPNDEAAKTRIRAPDERERVGGDGLTGFCPAGEPPVSVSHLPFVDAFIASMKNRGGRLATFPKVPPVQEFLGTADPRLTPAREVFDYMPLQDFGKIRKEVKPLKGQDGRPGKGPSREFSADRLLATPSVANFWR